jgi:hypothetical protein
MIMSRIICKTHGRQGVVELCCHLSDVLKVPDNFIHQDDFKVIKISYEDLDPDFNNEDCSVHYFCNQCVKKYELPVEKPILSDERDGIYKEVFKEMAIICIRCLEGSIIEQ